MKFCVVEQEMFPADQFELNVHNTANPHTCDTGLPAQVEVETGIRAEQSITGIVTGER